MPRVAASVPPASARTGGSAPRRDGIVQRVGLVNRLRTSLPASVVAISAPAGYGKTTLLAQWAERDGRRFVQLTLEETDNQPASLLARLASALAAGGATTVAGRSAGATSAAAQLAGLGVAFQALASPVVLALDNADVLTEPECLGALANVIDLVPAGSQLALAARTTLPLPFARLRVEGRLVEFGADDLRLTDREANALVRAAGIDLPDDVVKEINLRCEGWCAGLYLLVLATRAQRGVPARPVPPAKRPRAVERYFRREVLSHLSDEQAVLLRRASVLDRLSGPLCDAVLERERCGQCLEELERSNLFVVPLDRTRTWYRFHRLFRELLLAELEETEGKDEVAALRTRAGDWLEANGDVAAALVQFEAAGDIEHVTALLMTHAQRLYNDGAGATLERWFTSLDALGFCARHPAFAVYAGLVYAFAGRANDAYRMADQADAAGDDVSMPDGSTASGGWSALLRAVLCRDGVDRMLVDAELAVRDIGPSSVVRPAALVAAGAARLLAGDAAAAEPILAEAVELGERRGFPFVVTIALSQQAIAAERRGDLPRSDALLARAVAVLEGAPGVADYMQSGLVWAASARSALRAGHWEVARARLATAEDRTALLTEAVPWFAAQARLELARAQLALADVTAADAHLHESERLLVLRPDLGVLSDETKAIRREIASLQRGGDLLAAGLTAAELRLVPFLPTHLSFREIAASLNVSRNTVKTQAISIYRKLGVTSRGAAITRAFELGLATSAAPAGAAAAARPAGHSSNVGDGMLAGGCSPTCDKQH